MNFINNFAFSATSIYMLEYNRSVQHRAILDFATSLSQVFRILSIQEKSRSKITIALRRPLLTFSRETIFSL